MKIQFDFIADVLISATGESDVNAVYCDENVWLPAHIVLLCNLHTIHKFHSDNPLQEIEHNRTNYMDFL